MQVSLSCAPGQSTVSVLGSIGVVMAESSHSSLVALITGGTAGIGEACVRLFHSRGYLVGFCSNDAGAGARLQTELNSHKSDSSVFVECDVRDAGQIDHMVDEITNHFARLDVLINNVGVSLEARTLENIPVREIDDLLCINLRSYLLTTRRALPHLRRYRGAIVNVGSIAASIGHEMLAVYCATKGGISAFARAMAIDEARWGVRVNTVLPGNIITPSRDRLESSMVNPEAFHQLVETWQWLGRSGNADEVARVCLFLAGGESSFITGADIAVTGGAEIGFGPKVRCDPA
jgi:NAD(P)-dependent dehydrogenase (short-subunit alcohol dehydrogenase family)